VESGEIWDRYRTLDLTNPNSGLGYSLFNLQALVYTAHVVDSNPDVCNALLHSSPTSPLLAVEEKLENSNDKVRPRSLLASPEAPTSCLAYADKAILQALHFYGKYYILYPVGTPAQITYAPYQGQRPVYEGLAEFLVGCCHFPEDHVLQRVVEFNIMTPGSSGLQAKAKEGDSSKSKKEGAKGTKKKEGNSNSVVQKHKKPGEKGKKDKAGNNQKEGGTEDHYRFTHAEHPLNTPIYYLALVFCPFH
jgi:hypothetical protein